MHNLVIFSVWKRKAECGEPSIEKEKYFKIEVNFHFVFGEILPKNKVFELIFTFNYNIICNNFLLKGWFLFMGFGGCECYPHLCFWTVSNPNGIHGENQACWWLFIREQIGVWTKSPCYSPILPTCTQHCAIREHQILHDLGKGNLHAFTRLP